MFWSQMHGKDTKFAFTTSWRSSSAKLIGSKSRFTVACQRSSYELAEAKQHIYGIGSASLHWNLVERSVRGWKGTGELKLVWTTRQHLPWKSNQILAEGHSSNSLPVFLFRLFVLFPWSFACKALMESEVRQHHRRKWTELVASLTEPNPRNSGNIHCQPESVRFPAC